jgi:hypothetical protein
VRCALGLLLVFVLASDASAQFVRFDADAGEGRLEAAEVAFVTSKNTSRVSLFEMLHVADRPFYDEVQRALEDQQVVLYEGLKGKHEAADRSIGNYERFGRAVGLALQHESMKRGPSWVNADLSFEELARAIGPDALARDFATGNLDGTLALLDKQPTNEHLKWGLAESLGKAPRATSHVPARNAACLALLDRELEARPGGRLAIIYGAAHMPDFEENLAKRGYARSKVTWRTAWRIDRRARDRDEAVFIARLRAERQQRGFLGLLGGMVVGLVGLVAWTTRKRG